MIAAHARKSGMYSQCHCVVDETPNDSRYRVDRLANCNVHIALHSTGKTEGGHSKCLHKHVVELSQVEAAAALRATEP